MSVGRVSRTRPRAALKTSFEINFKLEVKGPGITDAEAAHYVRELLRYASAAYSFKVIHPTADNDAHGRDRHATWGGPDDVSVS